MGKYDNLIQDINEYADTTDFPILKELCYLKNYNYDTVMKYQKQNEDIKAAVKRLLYKKEAYLEREGLKGTINPTMAVFSLKQLGWRDKQDTDDKEQAKNGVITDLIGALKDAKKD